MYSGGPPPRAVSGFYSPLGGGPPSGAPPTPGDDGGRRTPTPTTTPKVTIPRKRPAPKRKGGGNSLLGVAENAANDHYKKSEDGEPAKLEHLTANRAGGPMRGRRPPTRKPMSQRATPLTAKPAEAENLSLVARQKPPPSNINVTAYQMNDKKKEEEKPPTAQVVDTAKQAEIDRIEREKHKSKVERVGKKTVMRVFLDNAGDGFKTVAITLPCNFYDLVAAMKKKVFTDTEGFGIWEVRDKRGESISVFSIHSHEIQMLDL